MYVSLQFITYPHDSFGFRPHHFAAEITDKNCSPRSPVPREHFVSQDLRAPAEMVRKHFFTGLV